MYRLYNFRPSGNCYKVRLLLTQLGIPFELIHLDISQQQTRFPEFLQKNANGKVPVLEIEPEVFLVESNSILLFLAEQTDYLPSDRLLHTRVIEWLFFEQYSLGANLSRPRFFMSVIRQPERIAPMLDYLQTLGYQALTALEHHLENHTFLVDERYTIADIALYAYTHVAHEGGYEMSLFPAIQAWIQRVRSQPNHIKIDE
jgi:glutathione S-transferase